MAGICQTLRDTDDSVKYDMTTGLEAQYKNAGPPDGAQSRWYA